MYNLSALGRNKSTISRELCRNAEKDGYSAHKAQKSYVIHRQAGYYQLYFKKSLGIMGNHAKRTVKSEEVQYRIVYPLTSGQPKQLPETV